MRIGIFAKNNNLSVDTIRYYIDLNLIHPIRRGKYFYFEKEQQDQLERLLYLKNLNFTLDEIKKIFSIDKLNKIETILESNLYEKILIEKQSNVEKQIVNLSKVSDLLKIELNKIKSRQKKVVKEYGIGFNNLDYICCPKCGKKMEFSEGVLKHNSIYDAKGECICGYTLLIKDGIVLANPNQNDIIDPYNNNQDYADELMNSTPKSFIEFMIMRCEEISRLLVEKNLSDKVLLFLKSGVGPAELNLLEKTTDIKLMILVDEDFDKLRIAKKSIDGNFPNVNVLCICSELDELPIRNKSIDIAIDFVATFKNAFRSDIDIYKSVNQLLKDKSSIMGLYLYFKKVDMFSRLDRNKWKFFDYRAIKQKIINLNYVETGNYAEQKLHEGSNINGFFKEEDKVHAKIMIFEGKIN